VDCPTCLQRTYLADAGTATCYFCGYACEGEDAAEEWIDRFGGFQDPSVEPCSECGAETCVAAGRVLEDYELGYVCLSCGESGNYRHCANCGQLYAGGESCCDDCFKDAVYSGD
jgi:hypothetical protein